MLSALLYKAGRFVIGSYSRLMLKMDVHWHGHLPSGPVLFAANHPSTNDPIYIHLISSRPMSVMITSKVFSIPVLGPYMRKMRQIEVVRGQGEQVLGEAREALAAGRSVVIFPEGAISPENGFAPVRSGVARLALQSGVPVVPIGIHLKGENCKRVPTMLDGEPDVITWYLHGPYAVTVGKPLHFRGNADDRPLVKAVAETIMEHIRTLRGESQLRMTRFSSGISWS